ncbi:MAG: DUF192 domain-containing protein [Pseudolabrys sp.]|jgi:uncharacterized membrane protein (UPF0127 family)
MRALKWIAFALVGLFVAASLARPIGQQPIEIATKSGVHVFTVEIVDNDADRAKGLMYRKELPEGQGMLFDFHRDQEVSFWMQNTYIPLDMIFIRGDGRISHIAENTEPLSTRLIPSNGPVRAVLEVIGGTSRKLGIAAGDRVASPIFNAR